MQNKYFIDIGQKARARRKELGYTAKDLSQICGISASAICRFESGKVEPRPETVKRIYDALGIRPEMTEEQPEPEMTEKQLEQKFVDAVKKSGGIAYKFTSPGHNGVPDRLVILPIAKTFNGEVLSNCGFVEVKKPGVGELSSVQEIELKRLTGYGVSCYVLDDPGQIGVIIRDIQTGRHPGFRFGCGGR